MLFQQTNMLRGWQWETVGKKIFQYHRRIQKSSALQWNGLSMDPVQIIILYPPFLPHQLLLAPTEEVLRASKWALSALQVRPHRRRFEPFRWSLHWISRTVLKEIILLHAGGLPEPGTGELTNTTGCKCWEGQELPLQQSSSHDAGPSCYLQRFQLNNRYNSYHPFKCSKWLLWEQQ